jgi:uncharacterized protein YyaL (SSP411 family)
MPQIVIAGPPAREDTQALVDAVRSKYLPTAITLRVDPSRQAELSRLMPWTAAMNMREGRATTYVCREFACQAPATDAAELVAQL